jgi:hypothetical protein
MAEPLSSSDKVAEADPSGNFHGESQVLPSTSFIGDGSGEIRQVLSELLSCNAVIPSKNRVKFDCTSQSFLFANLIFRRYGIVAIEEQSQDGVKSARLQRCITS